MTRVEYESLIEANEAVNRLRDELESVKAYKDALGRTKDSLLQEVSDLDIRIGRMQHWVASSFASANKAQADADELRARLAERDAQLADMTRRKDGWRGVALMYRRELRDRAVWTLGHRLRRPIEKKEADEFKNDITANWSKRRRREARSNKAQP